MAHPTQQRFTQTAVEAVLARLPVKRVLEVGSADINGSTRSLFAAAQLTSYCGVDVAAGPGVDKVSSGHLLDFPSGHFDAVLSFECFEHNPFWKETFINMVRMCRPGGAVIVTCAAPGRMEHGTTRCTPAHSFSVGFGWDYYRNIQAGELIACLNAGETFAYRFSRVDRRSGDLHFFGLKAGEHADGNAAYFADWFRQHDSVLKLNETDRATAALNLVFSYLEEGGLSQAPWLRFRAAQFLKGIKKGLTR